VEPAQTQIKLDQLPVGTRLIDRSRVYWCFAAISRIGDERVVLTVCSPTGRTYRLRRDLNSMLTLEGTLPVLPYDNSEHWRENFTRYDLRW
jgi:hypothetical protein